jgi:5-(carboxyamino)imidazole ribonucleotide synthase
VSFPTVGVIGAGQLARMMVPPAIDLGISLSLYAASSDDSGAQIAQHVIGDLGDTAAVCEWARSCDVVTFEHEQVPQELINAMHDEGITVFPSASAFAFSQNKLWMRQKMEELHLPNPQWQIFTEELTPTDIAITFPLIAKSITGGYDGRGVFVIDTFDELMALHQRMKLDQKKKSGIENYPIVVELLLEEQLSFDYELSVMVARSPHGQAATWAPTLTVQRDGICIQTITPIPNISMELSERITHVALSIAQGIDLVGVMAVEMFVVGEALIINELALRPHNSGHWSIEGSVTSQFEQHLRAVLDLPLGDTQMLAQFAVMGNLIGIQTEKSEDLYRPYLHLMARIPDLKIHQDMKQLRPGRKVGHVTLLGDDLLHLSSEVTHAVDYLMGAIDE